MIVTGKPKLESRIFKRNEFGKTIKSEDIANSTSMKYTSLPRKTRMKFMVYVTQTTVRNNKFGFFTESSRRRVQEMEINE